MANVLKDDTSSGWQGSRISLHKAKAYETPKKKNLTSAATCQSLDREPRIRVPTILTWPS